MTDVQFESPFCVNNSKIISSGMIGCREAHNGGTFRSTDMTGEVQSFGGGVPSSVLSNSLNQSLFQIDVLRSREKGESVEKGSGRCAHSREISENPFARLRIEF